MASHGVILKQSLFYSLFTIQDRFLYNSDIGVIDQDGYGKIVGRAKDMLIRGGDINQSFYNLIL